MDDNETKNTLIDHSGPVVPNPVEPDSVLADLPSIEIVFDPAVDGLAAAGEAGPAQDTSDSYLLDDIDLADIIADFEAPELTDLTALLHQPLDALPLYRAPDEQEGVGSTTAVLSASETHPAPTLGDASGSAVDGLFSGTVTIIVEDGDGGYGSTV